MPQSPSSGRLASGRAGVIALAGAAGVLIALVAVWSPAMVSAAPDLKLSPSSGPPGTSVQASGNGWPGGVSVTFTWDQSTRLGEANASSAGAVTFSFTVPAGAATGSHAVTALPAPPGGMLTGSPPAVGTIFGSPPPDGGPIVIGSPPPGVSPPAGLGPPGGFATPTPVTATFTVTAASSTWTPTPPPAAAQASVTMSATASPAATPTPTATLTVAPAVSAYAVATVDMSQPCIPANGQTTCDEARLRLWQGDQAAWTARFAERGRPAPSPDDVFQETFGFRVEAGDPAAIATVAQGLGWPHVRIVGARFRATDGEGEWIEVKNLGGAQQDMTGWSLRVESTGARWRFLDGFVLAPGQTCRISADEAAGAACAVLAERGRGRGDLLPDSAGLIALWVDELDLKANEVRYSSDPARQPPPPNLKGEPGGLS